MVCMCTLHLMYVAIVFAAYMSGGYDLTESNIGIAI